MATNLKPGDIVSWSDTSSNLPRDRRPRIFGKVKYVYKNKDVKVTDGKKDKIWNPSALIWLRKEK